MTWTPHPKQALFLQTPAFEALYGGSAGGGKAGAISTPIRSYDEWKTLGTIEAGDVVFDERGQPCRVLVAHPVFTPTECYRVTFDDTSTVDVCADHLWLTFSASELTALSHRDPEWRARRRAKRPPRLSGHKSAVFTESLRRRNAANPRPSLPAPTGTVRNTRDIANSLRLPSGRTNHAIPVAKALQWPTESLPVDPYICGLFVGDGETSGAIHQEDPEIADSLRAAGYEVGTLRDGRAYLPYGLRQDLEPLGIIYTKLIPPSYMMASEEQRLALLQGIMDTDGCVDAHDGGVDYQTMSRELAEQMRELICSLGMKANIRLGRAVVKGRDYGEKYRLTWQPDRYVFRLPRKRDRQRLATRRTTRFRYMVDCQPIDPVPMRCITVDSPSGLYLIGRTLIPTHNTSALLVDAARYTHIPGYAGIIFRRTYPQLSQPGGIIDQSWEFYSKHAKWGAELYRWAFGGGNGGSISFGHMQHEKDKYGYQGGQFAFIGFDQVEQFGASQYEYLMSRARSMCGAPVRVRCTANPPSEDLQGIGDMWWVKRRWLPWLGTKEECERAGLPQAQDGDILWFKKIEDNEVWVKPNTPGALSRTCIKATVYDNPALLEKDPEYLARLQNLPLLQRERLLNGNWDIAASGNVFKREWFQVVDAEPEGLRWVRAWDLAYSTKTAADYTASCKVAIDHNAGGFLYVKDMIRGKWEWPEQERMILQTFQNEPGVETGIEQSVHGMPMVQQLLRSPAVIGAKSGLKAIDVQHTTKFTRAQTWSSWAERGHVRLVRGNWIAAFLDEAEVFDGGDKRHDDQIDAVGLAFLMLARPAYRKAAWLKV